MVMSQIGGIDFGGKVGKEGGIFEEDVWRDLMKN